MAVDKAKYAQRPMEELELAAMVGIGVTWKNRPLRCGNIGNEIFRGQPGVINGSAPYARLAGKVMRRLQAQGLAEYIHDGSGGGWSLTAAGMERVKGRKRPD